MLKLLIKLSLRQFFKNKVYSFINIFGLTIGMICFILIFLYVESELSYDSFHKNIDKIYRVNQELTIDGEQKTSLWTPYELGRALKEEFPDVENCARLTKLLSANILVKYEKKDFFEQKHVLIDPSFFEIFNFHILYGDIHSFYSELNSVVISEKIAQKYFGNQNPIGEILSIDDELNFIVTGVVQIPLNTDFLYDFFFPIQAFQDKISSGWQAQMFQTFVQLKDNVSPIQVQTKIWELQKKNIPEESIKNGISFQKFKEIHLYRPDGKHSENVKYLYILGLSGIFILIIACINFINLSTAQSLQRAKEIGIQKTLGAQRKNIIIQFYFETVILSVVAFFLAIISLKIILPVFNQVLTTNLKLNLSNNNILAGLTLSWLFTVIISGFYPSIILSSYNPIKILKGVLNPGNKGAYSRKALVIFQFVLSIFFITSTLIINSQLNFIKSRYQDFKNEQLMYIRLDGGTDKNAQTLKNELLQYPEFVNISINQQLPLNIRYSSNIWSDISKDPGSSIDINYCIGDFDFIKTFNMQIVAGRDFSTQMGTDDLNCIINEEAAKKIGFENIIGKQIVYWDNKVGKIIGVVKNFNYKHANQEIEPLIICARPDWYDLKYFVFRVAKEDQKSALQKLNKEWNKINPGFPFEYKYFEDVYNKIYRNELIIGKIFFYFTLIIILISCMGLLGLATFTAERKKREIGLRKVFGASYSQVLIVINLEFIKWVIMAIIIAWPLVYYSMMKWLETFDYQTTIKLWMFGVSGLSAILISILSVTYISFKAVKQNPVETLRYE